MVLTLDHQQNIFLNDKPVNINELPAKLHEAGTDPDRQVIYLRADEGVPFGAFAKLMDAVKLAGITNISIVTQPLDEKSSTASRN
jgi:biopolymer transport protein ExbD/biopolymer transport protein TolR